MAANATEALPAHSLVKRAILLGPVAILRALAGTANRTPIEGVEWEPLEIPSRDAGRTIKAYRYYRSGSKGGPGGIDANAPRDVVVNFHGSGWVLHHHGMDHEFAGHIVKNVDIDFIDMDYRKGPESPFPAGHNDAEDAILHFARSERTKSLAVTGFSAGANMAISAPAHLYKEIAASPIKTISSISTLYPPCDWTVKHVAPSKNFEGGGLALEPPLTTIFDSSMVVDPRDQQGKRFSLIKLSKEEIPTENILAICGTADFLHDGGEKFIKLLQDAGHPHAEFISLPNAGHAYDKDTARNPQTDLAREYTRKSYDAIVANIKRGLGQA